MILQNNTYIQQLNGENNYGSGTMRPSYGFFWVFLNFLINTILLQGNTYCSSDSWTEKIITDLEQCALVWFFIGFPKLADKYDPIAGQHIHPTAGRGGDSRHAGGLQAGQRGQHRGVRLSVPPSLMKRQPTSVEYRLLICVLFKITRILILKGQDGFDYMHGQS
jgi:hypothetical protein